MTNNSGKQVLWAIFGVMVVAIVLVGARELILRQLEPRGYRNDIAKLIREHGDVEELIRECMFVANTLGETNMYLMNPTNLPPMLSKLNPQLIALSDTDGYVDVMLSGGFSHRGLLVCTNMTDQLPAPYHRWLKGAVGKGVYEYRE